MSKRTKKFKTEVQQLLDLVIHSLYSKKEIFLRELISNASDAIDRARFEALTDTSILDEGEAWEILIESNSEARTLTIKDNGIGMNLEELDANIGTIASSGTRAFLDKLKESKEATPELIGQFGVGFYSAFMVADRVDVLTRRAGKDQQAFHWVSTGAGNYTVEEAEKEGRGTSITLHLRDDVTEFADEWRIRQIVKQYSDYISYPVTMDVERTQKGENEGDEEVKTVERETLNSMKAIWKRSKGEVKEEEYNEFYKAISHDYTDPLRTIHFSAEGVTEFKSLLFLPAKAPFDIFFREQEHGLHLYVKNVFIGDDFKTLLPEYLRFMRGVVDSSDLPLNVSREILQDDAILRRIRKSLVSRVLSTLAEMQEKQPEEYLIFWRQFGKVLKEGIHSDYENKDKLQKLALFPSTMTEEGKLTSLQEYVDRMPSAQAEIYYLSGESLEAASKSPLLEAFKARSFEVLYFVDPIDEWVSQGLTEFDSKKLKAIDRGDIDLADESEKAEVKKRKEEQSETFKALLETVQEQLKAEVKEVRLSNRLTESACCLVADEMGMNANMERIMRAMNQDVPASKRILELNPAHPVFEKMQSLAASDKASELLADYVALIYDQALIAEGSAVKDPLRFTKLISRLMVANPEL